MNGPALRPAARGLPGVGTVADAGGNPAEAADLVCNPQGRVTKRIQERGESQVCTSIFVAAELRYGAIRKGSPRLAAQLEAVLDALEILPFEPPDDATYGALRARLERTGKPVGGNDLLIAAQAVTHRLTIITDNEPEFARIDDLLRENWLRRA